MILYVKTEEELAKANRIGKSRTRKKLIVDPISYTGKRGNYMMEFDGNEYVPHFLIKSYSLLVGFNYDEIERIVLGRPEKK